MLKTSGEMKYQILSPQEMATMVLELSGDEKQQVWALCFCLSQQVCSLQVVFCHHSPLVFCKINKQESENINTFGELAPLFCMKLTVVSVGCVAIPHMYSHMFSSYEISRFLIEISLGL
jgi:hypothetical protein